MIIFNWFEVNITQKGEMFIRAQIHTCLQNNEIRRAKGMEVQKD